MSNVGCRIFTELPRPPKELVERFRGLPVANIGDNMNRIYCVDSAIRSMNGKPMLGVAYTLQVVGQVHTPPAAASLLMSFESVFSVLSGAVVLGERLSLKEGIGCVIMFAAILLSQLGDIVISRIKGNKPGNGAAA